MCRNNFKIRQLALILICFYLWNEAVFAEALPANSVNLCGANDYSETIRDLWNKRKPVYLKWIMGSDKKPINLYNLQGETNNLLKYAGYCKDRYILEELLTIYLKALETIDESDEYAFYYYPGSQKRSIHKLDQKYRMWLDDKEPIGDESILSSAQFLYLISDAIKIITDIESSKHSPVMREFFDKYAPVFGQHYKRWILDSMGPFQVRGWGCKMGGKYVKTGMNHAEFLQKKLLRSLGDDSSPSYCNAVTDTDLWIIAAISNLLAVSEKFSIFKFVAPSDLDELYCYFATGTQLIESRITYANLKDFNEKPVKGANFDIGSWDDHPNYAHAGIDEQNINDMLLRAKKPVENIGWDISHARRFVHVFESLYRNKTTLNTSFPTRELMKRLSNQLLYGVFNRDFKRPLFTNFMDGTNGWFRVNYSERIGFGYAPWDMSSSVLTGGFGFWSVYNKDIEPLFKAMVNMLGSDDPKIKRHVEEYYEKSFWNNYERKIYSNFTDKNNIYTQVVLIQLLPSMCFHAVSAQGDRI